MISLRCPAIFTISLLLVVLAGYAWPTEATDSEGRSSLEVRSRTLTRQADLQGKEKELVAELLTWDVKIEAARQERDRLQREIPVIERSLADAEAGLKESSARYDDGMKWLGRWVNFLYRYGPAAYLEVILGASTFNDFVERAEAVKIAIVSQVKMLDEVRRLAKRMEEQVLACSRARADLEARSGELAVTLKEMEEFRAGRQDFLTGLRKQSAELAVRIVQAETSWYRSLNSLHHLLTHLQYLPWQSLSPEKVAFAGGKVVVAYSDSEINNKFFQQGNPDFTGFSVRSTPGLFSITGPAAAGGPEFNMDGNFLIEGGGKVRFEPLRVSLAGTPVSREVVDFISSDTAMEVDLGSISKGYHLSEIRLEEGRLVLIFGFQDISESIL